MQRSIPRVRFLVPVFFAQKEWYLIDAPLTMHTLTPMRRRNLSVSNVFIEPPPENHTHPWLRMFPDLPEEKARWFFETLLPEHQVTTQDLTQDQHGLITMLRDVVGRYADLDLGLFKCRILFSSGSIDQLLRPEVLSGFDWDGFFKRYSDREFMLSQRLYVFAFKAGIRARAAWHRVPLETRLYFYEILCLLDPDFIKQIEGVERPQLIPPSFWQQISKHPDWQGSLSELLLQAQEPYDLLDSSDDYNRALLRTMYLPLISESSANLLPKLYQDDFLATAAKELMDFIQTTLESNAKESLQYNGTFGNAFDSMDGQNLPVDLLEVATLGWNYLCARLSAATPEDAFEFLSLFLPLSADHADGMSGYYFGSLDAITIQASASTFVDILMREDLYPLIKQSLAGSCEACRKHDPFAQAILEELDARLAANPDSRLVCLYSLWVRCRCWSFEDNYKMYDLKSLKVMVAKSLKSEGTIAPFLTLCSYCEWDQYLDIEWRSALAKTLVQAGTRDSELIAADARNRLVSKLPVEPEDSSLVYALFSNPSLHYAGLLFDKEFQKLLCADSGTYNPDGRFLVSVALVLDIKPIKEWLLQLLCEPNPELILPQGSVFLPFAVHTATILNNQSENSSDLLKELEGTGLIDSLPLNILTRFVDDKVLLLQSIVSRHFSRSTKVNKPTVSEFKEKYRTLLEDECSGPAILPVKLRSGARQVLEQELQLRLPVIIADPLTDEAVIGLGLADLLNGDESFNWNANPELANLIGRAAQRWLDALRAAARNSDSWDELPSPTEGLKASFFLLWKLKGPWYAAKQLLTIFRLVPVQAIDPDLAPSLRGSDKGWQLVAVLIHRIFDRPWSNEEGREIRAMMTHDLLEKLKPSKNQSKRALVEPDAVWRYAYVRAVADLGADPSDTGHFHHQVLDKCAANDPDPKVRKAAADASAGLKTRSGWKAGSGKRMLLHAWWWIRQAHLISHEVAIIDQEGALKRREAETRI
jgi:hypothetical protein